MHIQIRTDNHIVGSARLAREVETLVENALRRFGDRITRVEVYLSDENSSCKSGDDDKRCVMEVRLAKLEPITVSHLGSSLEQAVGGAAATLAKTLKRTLGRKGSLFKRRARARAEFTAVDPLLQHDVDVGNEEDFLTLLRPLLEYLREYADRELRILEGNGLLLPDQVAAADVLSEVLSRAWLQFAGRRRQMPLDLWLVSLLDETLGDRTKLEAPLTCLLDQHADEARSGDPFPVDIQPRRKRLFGENETTTLRNAISRDESDSAAEQLEADELKSHVHSMLGALPKAKRQAFALNFLKAYEPLEIAMLQDRAEVEVQADIDAVRNALVERLGAVARA